MSEITLTINGKEAKGQQGDTILAACERAGIALPTLCHLKGVHDIGTCRMCIVELAGGRITTACTTPVEEGMTVTTDSDRLTALRRSTLELLFAERNHYCMFCAASGDCELQALAYRLGMDHVRYPGLYPRVETDTSHEHKVFDQNRCILCRRCLRACNELVANHTLGIRDRGIHSMLSIDGGEPFADSTCASCGTCVQVCPTGALFDRRSVFRGRKEECTLVKSTCPECSLGCPVELVARSGQVLRVDADLSAENGTGLLCKKGRYESLGDARERVRTPLARKEGVLQPVSWDEAISTAREGLAMARHAHGASSVIGVASARLSTEALAALRSYVETALVPTNAVALGAQSLFDRTPDATTSDLLAADLILLAGEDACASHEVVGFLVNRAVEQNGTALVLIGSAARRLVRRARVHLPADGAAIPEALRSLGQVGNPVAPLLAAAKRPLFILCQPAGEIAFEGAVPGAEAGWPRLLRLGEKANSRGAAAAGLSANGIDRQAAKAILCLAGDDADLTSEALDHPDGQPFLVVHAAYRTPLTERADVVLPAPLWIEKSGTMVNAQGQEVHLRAAVEPPPGVRDESEVLMALSS
ncbi:MAG TPA: molybdopterin-dependent oxidoreductase [Armatimonadetes bacterium]|jgi:formate dehydrogenase major subunit|nr:molybdopterin-dependent oxidoreductase [Armatimonadota bacterium]